MSARDEAAYAAQSPNVGLRIRVCHSLAIRGFRPRGVTVPLMGVSRYRGRGYVSRVMLARGGSRNAKLAPRAGLVLIPDERERVGM